MRRAAVPFLLCALVGSLVPARAPGAEAAPARDAEVASLRFAWPPGARARVTYRRTRLRTGTPTRVFTARYELRSERGDDGVRVTTRGTSWRGTLPYPAPLARNAIKASEKVVQRIGADGEFRALEGVEALRPVLGRVLEDAKVPADQAERALAVALAAARAEAEELWNLAVGFWTGADLRVGETYAMQSESALPLLAGARAPHAVEFSVRRRVPCSSGERAVRCVEAVLRSVPERAAVERNRAALLERVLPPGATGAARDGAARDGAARDLSVESELVLVTDPQTLLPRRLVWTRAVRLGAAEGGPPAAEWIERNEYDYRWIAPAPPRSSAPRPAAAAPLRSPAASRAGSG